MISGYIRASVCAIFGAAFLSILQLSAEAPKFKGGDRVVFIGDSITHGGGFNYHNQVALFYATRFPKEKIESWNCGIAGDSAAGAVRRYDWDIAPHKATAATIMLGMNDVGRNLYATGKSGEKVEEQRKKAIDGSNANMDKLASMLVKDGVLVTFITPSLFDQTGNQKTDKLVGVNDALKACGEYDRELAKKYKGGIADFNGPMEKINKEWQAKDPDFTIVGGDRVHPGAFGHLVMAYLLLKEQGMAPTVATMDVDAATGKVSKQANCAISNLSVKDGSVSFDCLENALPFPVMASASKALEMVPFTEDLNQETIKVSGLKDGEYELLIDGQPVMKASAAAFAAGMNLATIQTTPQYKQALEVFNLLNARCGIFGKMRQDAQIEHGFLSRLKNRSPEGDKKAVEEKLEAIKKEESPHQKYYIYIYTSYLKELPEKDVWAPKAAELLDKAYAAAQPKPHKFLLRPAK